MDKPTGVNFISKLYKIARQLAKSNKYQMLYTQYKELGCSIFNNTTNFSSYQIHFINYLSFYSSLYMDIYTGDVGDVVLKDVIFEDAYMEYKSKSKKEKRREQKQEQSVALPRNTKGKNKYNTGRGINTPVKSTNIIFKKGKRK